MKKFGWILFYVFLFCFILFGVYKCLSSWSVYVYDIDTNEPITDAQVNLEYREDLWNGCIHNVIEITNQKGYINSGDIKNAYEISESWPQGQAEYVKKPVDSAEFLTSKNICDITVSKEGYIMNGYHRFIHFFPFSFHAKIALQKLTIGKHPFNSNNIYEGDGLDFLNLIESETVKIHPIPQKLLAGYDIDIKLQAIEGSESDMKLLAQGDGGIQEIFYSEHLKNNIDTNFLYENFISPPLDGYKKEAVISNRKQYILRLRDGKTYIKFKAKIGDHNGRVSAIFDSIIFFNRVTDDLIINKKELNKREVIAYPEDRFISTLDEISLEGRGFSPNEQISFDIENTDMVEVSSADENGEWKYIFADDWSGPPISIFKDLFMNGRPLVLNIYSNSEKSDYTQRVLFKIISIPPGKIYFGGLILSFPDNLNVWKQYGYKTETIQVTDKNIDSNSYIIISKDESYLSYLLNLRQMNSLMDTSIPGVVKYFRDSTVSPEYSFYDSRVKRSYKFFESIYERKKSLNWDIEYPLSFIEDEQIQQ